jgi:hypothetical protein
MSLTDALFSAPVYFASAVLGTYYLHRYNKTQEATALVDSPWSSSLDTASLHTDALISVVLQIFNHHGLLEYVSLSDFYRQLKSLSEPVSTYGPTYRCNPYHNFAHACHVLVNAHRLFIQLRADLEINTSDGDKLAFFLGALFHDLDHDGRSNEQHRADGSPGNAHGNTHGNTHGKSPLETNSISLATTLCFVKFLRLPPGTQERFETLFASLLLCTDIGDKEGATKLRATRQTESYLHWALRLADIGCVMQDYETYCRWAYLLCVEQRAAGSDTTLEEFASENLDFLKGYVREEVSFASDLFEEAGPGMAACLEANVARLEGLTVEERARDMRKHGSVCWRGGGAA